MPALPPCAEHRCWTADGEAAGGDEGIFSCGKPPNAVTLFGGWHNGLFYVDFSAEKTSPQIVVKFRESALLERFSGRTEVNSIDLQGGLFFL